MGACCAHVNWLTLLCTSVSGLTVRSADPPFYLVSYCQERVTMLTLAITDTCSGTVKTQNPLRFPDPEITEHRSKVSTLKGGARRQLDNITEPWPLAVFFCFLMVFDLDEDLIM